MCGILNFARLFLVVASVYCSRQAALASLEALSESPSDAPTRSQEVSNMLGGELKGYGISFNQGALLEGLSSGQRPARLACLRGLGEIGKLDAVGPIGKLLEDRERVIKIAALRAIDAIVRRETQRAKTELLKASGTAQDRFDVALLLVTLGEPSGFAEVLRAVENPKSDLFLQAVSNAPRFAKYQLWDEGKTVNWVHVLSLSLKKGEVDAPKRAAIVGALCQMGSPEALAVCQGALASETVSEVRLQMKYMIDGVQRK